MTWTGQTFSAGQVLTAVQMNNLQNDITGQANGDSGAPKNKLASMDTGSVDSAQIVASAVTQGKLSTTTGEVSHNTTSLTNKTLPGGEYGFYPQLKCDSGTTLAQAIIGGALSNTSYVTNIALDRNSGTGFVYAQQRYVQASPPYDLGDGEIALFIFLLLDTNTQEILGTYIAPEAPWHHNGPTIIRPDEYVDGIPYRNVKHIPPGLEADRDKVIIIKQKMQGGGVITDDDRFVMRDFYIAIRNQPKVRMEITQAIKNADMNLVPHPFPDYDPASQTVVMLDGLNPLAEQLLLFMQDEGADFDATKMFAKRFFTIGTTPLTRSGPPGVIQLAYNWRQTP
jgi:hypothetical protein